jgi:sugar lactone lactonase YvrE
MNLVQSSVQHMLAARARLGEGPVWEPERQQLYWVDILNQRVHQFDPARDHDRYFAIGDLVTALAIADSTRLLLALSDRLAFLDLETGAVNPVYQIEFPHPNTRLNDGKCDPQGRFWIGSISDAPEQAALYRYDPDGSFHQMESGLTISNGLGWSPDGSTFYLTDSPQRKIFAYQFEAETGAIRDRRVLIDLGGEAVEPDGLTIDAQGNIWSALWDGWCVACFDPAGKEIQRIKLPVQRPTCPTFGGVDLNELYITSASIGLSQKEIQQQFDAGDLFCVTTVTHGSPTHRFAG